ncbi:hypothetical protein RchiOBHm_Chr5g0050241 [Rosa chinensis]|uniref:Uncharacterized protein n=1 Tax=Rosa chinensis TaxID=74649 RepID=A0A2P6QF10_ROSCH|nr:hypothetical protein RchiOBHm_Chr5g0050241 [Rosa chinensis]
MLQESNRTLLNTFVKSGISAQNFPILVSPLLILHIHRRKFSVTFSA